MSWPLLFSVQASRQSSQKRSATARNSSRNLEGAIRERIARLQQTEVAKSAGLEKTAMHRIVSSDRGVYLDELHDFLAALDLAAIECDGDMVSVPRSEYEALRTLAKRGLE